MAHGVRVWRRLGGGDSDSEAAGPDPVRGRRSVHGEKGSSMSIIPLKSPLPQVSIRRSEPVNLRKTVFDNGFLLRPGKFDIHNPINFRRLALHSLPGT